jgi:ubiquinone/menaquinone biosynthesis C-methylase UbiE
MPPSFDRIARAYRWLEYLSFGLMLERCRFFRLRQIGNARRVLVLGDGDGRFLARLVKGNPRAEVDAVDLSPAMLHLLRVRAAEAGASERVRTYCVDAREFIPTGSYDLVVTHFFLDCLTTNELCAIIARIRRHLTLDARWVVSEFATPPGLISLPARLVVGSLYAAFGVLTGLRVRRLPDYAAALRSAGLVPSDSQCWLGGLIVSELWKTDGAEHS